VSTALDLLPPIDLATLDEAAALLDRIDRKYVVPLAVAERLVTDLAAVGDDWRVLKIDGARSFGYSSVYFDDRELSTYRAHLQRRRRRYKVRVRRYTDSGLCMLEVKRKGLRGRTEKVRRPHPSTEAASLGRQGWEFVADALDGYLPPPDPHLGPVLVTANRRTTLVTLSGGARVTLDTELTTGWGPTHAQLRPDLVLIESKVAQRSSHVDRLLRSYGHRPVRISKFCVGVASIEPGLPSNPWRRTMRQFFDIAAPEE
jgi:hypothetical protein